MRRICSALLAVLLVLTLVPQPLTAQQQQVGQALEISPPLLETQVDPGQKTELVIKIRNVANSRVIVKSSFDDFTAQGEGGEPKLLLDAGEASPYSLKKFLAPIEDISLVPQESKTVKVAISIPADIGPGGYFGVVRFTAVPPEAEGNAVALSASIGSLVFARVTGPAKEELKLDSFTSHKAGRQGSLFEYGPVGFTERFTNSGNVFMRPEGTITVKDTFGKDVAKLKVNERKNLILPGTSRKFEQSFGKKLMFGRYKATLDYSYGSGKKGQSSTITFWIIPYKLIALVLLALLIFFGGGWLLLKLYKRRIIAKVKKAQRQENVHAQHQMPQAPPVQQQPRPQPPRPPRRPKIQ
jgi:hypothetical protein